MIRRRLTKAILTRAMVATAWLVTGWLVTGCGSAPQDDPILKLSGEEAFAEGQRLMADKKYSRAQEYLSHAFQVSPNSEIGREALLMQADALFQAAGETNYVKAEARYRDFLNRFPTSDRAEYAQYQLAQSLEARMRKPDRDQSPTRRALEAYQELLELYPLSEYGGQAREGVARAETSLAEHEFLVGKYQLRRGLPGAAKARFETLLDWYPDYPETDKALFFLGRAHRALGEVEEASDVFRRLRSEYPDSAYGKDIPKLGPAARSGSQEGASEAEDPELAAQDDDEAETEDPEEDGTP